ncbi:DNA methyltransferase [Haloplanus litoreus]|uniref:DNA methyltransferase n=1 Tax=Haloplanus litoreus TaxID=767515 RepID=UPI003609AD44
MRTTHALHVGDAAAMDGVADESVPLVVTSPPYPMIDLWDDLFASRDPDVRAALDAGDGDAAFELMHAQLDAVWDEIERVLEPGGSLASTSATPPDPSAGGSSSSRTTPASSTPFGTGLTPLPDVLWRKPTNSLTKFMGSGTLPPNAHVTLEHEYILLFRKGGTRSFPPGDDRRYESAFFWEERNEWFSDLWEVRGRHRRWAGARSAATARRPSRSRFRSD